MTIFPAYISEQGASLHTFRAIRHNMISTALICAIMLSVSGGLIAEQHEKFGKYDSALCHIDTVEHVDDVWVSDLSGDFTLNSTTPRFNNTDVECWKKGDTHEWTPTSTYRKIAFSVLSYCGLVLLVLFVYALAALEKLMNRIYNVTPADTDNVITALTLWFALVYICIALFYGGMGFAARSDYNADHYTHIPCNYHMENAGDFRRLDISYENSTLTRTIENGVLSSGTDCWISTIRSPRVRISKPLRDPAGSNALFVVSAIFAFLSIAIVPIAGRMIEKIRGPFV